MRLGVFPCRVGTISSVVSIPAWCDWETGEFVTLTVNSAFQFQLGAIGSLKRLLDKDESMQFQFQLGAIGSAKF